MSGFAFFHAFRWGFGQVLNSGGYCAPAGDGAARHGAHITIHQRSDSNAIAVGLLGCATESSVSSTSLVIYHDGHQSLLSEAGIEFQQQSRHRNNTYRLHGLSPCLAGYALLSILGDGILEACALRLHIL